MLSTKGQEVPEIFPRPKEIILGEGTSNLSADVRLVTNNVSPLQRKAVRTILSEAGVRVVANKKTYVVEAKVESPSAFDMTHVPEVCRKDYYEVEISGSCVYVRAPEQEGIVWGSETAAALFRLFIKGQVLPNMKLRDWPAMSLRGVYVQATWGIDRMTSADWYKMIDHLCAMKLNVLGLDLYNCLGSCRFEAAGKPAEFLLTAPSCCEGAKTAHNLNWYSAAKEIWHKENYVPMTVENDTVLPEVIAYALERGMRIVPGISTLGHNTFLSRMFPQVSAKGKDGKPSGVGFCMTSPDARKFVEKFLGAVIDKYFPSGLEYFHIKMDDVLEDMPWPGEPDKAGSPWCNCENCSRKKKEDNFLDYICWLIDVLLNKGVKKVVLWTDQLIGRMELFDASFARRLDEYGMKNKVILHWRCSSNDELDKAMHISSASKLGVHSWVAPVFGMNNWSDYDYRRPNIDKMLRLAEKEDLYGAVAFATPNPTQFDHEALLGAYAWESTKDLTMENVQRRWAENCFGSKADAYIQALDKLLETMRIPSYRACLYANYCNAASGKELPKYPLAALEKVEADSGAQEALAKARANALEGDALLQEVLQEPQLTEEDKTCLNSLRAEFARVRFYVDAFSWMLELRRELKNGMILKRMVDGAIKAKDEVLVQLKVFEDCKATWEIPASMHAMDKVLLFIERLTEDMKSRIGKKQAKLLVWHLENK